MKNKYNAKRCRDVQGNYLASRLEADVSNWLIACQQEGKYADIRRQATVTFPCGNTWCIDFKVTLPDGTIFYVEAKGMETGGYVKQKRMLKCCPTHPLAPLFVIKRRGKDGLYVAESHNCGDIEPPVPSRPTYP